MTSKPDRQAVSFEELAYSSMLQAQALAELLEEKGILSQDEILARVKKLRSELAKKEKV